MTDPRHQYSWILISKITEMIPGTALLPDITRRIEASRAGDTDYYLDIATRNTPTRYNQQHGIHRIP